MVLLAIETSCDDTGIAIFKEHKLVANILKSSTNMHKKYGGIIPEIAARKHESDLPWCLNQTIKQAKININEITHIAYTSEPGLPGSLHVGKVFAKSLATLLKTKLIPINHLYGHAFSFALTNKNIIYPFISLIASGGETAIYLVKDINKFQVLNKTSDDAIGEVLDKIGRKLNLTYPGGKAIDQIYDAKKNDYPLIKHFEPQKQFSFSGFKTHILNLINNKKSTKVQIASSVLKWVVDEILIKLNYYTKLHNIKTITCGGGVTANSLLRSQLKFNYHHVLLTDIKYCNDNAAMIGLYAMLLNRK